MRKIEIYTGQIRWPNKCAFCGGVATKQLPIQTANLVGAVNLGVVLAINSSVVTVYHPICKKHFFVGWLASGLSQKSMFYLGLGLFATFFAIFVPVMIYGMLTGKVDRTFGGFEIFSIVFPVVYWGLYFWAKRNTAVKFTRATATELQFAFNNDAYANEFASANGGTSLGASRHKRT